MSFMHDVRVAARTLARQPAFSLTVVGLLGVALGANTAIFSLIDRALLGTLPFAEPARLVMGRATFSGRINPSVSGYDYYDYREQSASFDGLAAMAGFGGRSTILIDGEPDRAPNQYATWDLFQTLGVTPAAGRFFREDEGAAGRDQAIVISYAYWQGRFGGSPGAIGRDVIVDGRPKTIVGVLPATFHLLYDADVWKLLYRDSPLANARRFHNLLLVGRLRAGVSLAEAQGEVDVISRRLQQEYPDTNATKALRLTGLRDVLVEGVRTNLLLLMGAVALLLLMACANVAGLQLARGQSLQAEIAVRSAVGASRWELVRPFIAESLLLALGAGALGLAIASALQGVLLQLLPVGRLGIASVGIDWTVLAFALGLSFFSAMLFGVLPAIRGTAVNPADQLRPGVRTTEGAAGARVRSALVVVQVALGLVLLVGAGLLARSLARQLAVELGFDTSNLLTASIQVSPLDYREPAQGLAFFNRLVAEARSLPGVQDAGMVSHVPIQNGGGNIYIRRPGQAFEASMDKSADFRVVTPGYLETLRLPIVAGRDVSEADGPDSPRVVLVSQSVAALLFPGESPLGQTLVIDLGEPVAHEIVGIVADARLRSIRGAPFHAMYVPLAQQPRTQMFLAVRATGDPSALVGPLRERLGRMDPKVPFAEPKTMAAIVSGATADGRVIALALGLFAIVALGVALVGLFSVLEFYVRQRRREIGVRMAMGATTATILRLVLGRGLGLVAIGLVAGTIGATFATGALRTLLYETAPTDPAVLIGMPLLFAATAVAACLLPAWRATTLNPVEALRTD